MQSLRLIGYWGDGDPSGWPRAEDFVDADWDLAEREDLSFYLRHGMRVRFYLGPSFCRLCGIKNGSQEQTDGTFLWPEGLAHYVEVHAVRLPDEFVQHSRLVQEAFDSAEVDSDWWRQLQHP